MPLQEAGNLQALEEFVVNNQDLDELTSLLDQFNIFVAMGAVRQELRHSDFLAFLLDPTAGHGLGDAFLSRFLMRAVHGSVGPVGVIDIHVADLGGATVLREWRHIDILVHDEVSRLVCVIENKIGTGEHSDQLRRYRETVEAAYPDLRPVLLFLTPDGEPPSDDTYIAVSYSLVRDVVDDVRSHYGSRLGPDVATMLQHYSEMIGRYIVSDSDVATLCKQIYFKHKRALDLIYEHRPDIASELAEVLKRLREEAVASHGLIEGYTSTKVWISFSHDCFNELNATLKAAGWDQELNIYFTFGNWAECVALSLYLEAGPAAIRQALFEHALANPGVFKECHNKLNKDTPLFRTNLLTADDYAQPDLSSMTDKLRGGWEVFLRNDLPAICESLAEVAWPTHQES